VSTVLVCKLNNFSAAIYSLIIQFVLYFLCIIESLLLTSDSLWCRFYIRRAVFCVLFPVAIYFILSHLLLNSFDFRTESLIFNKSLLLSLTQYRFVVIQFVTRTCVLHASVWNVGYPEHKTHTKEDVIKISSFFECYLIFLCMVFVLTCLRIP
jgi:hypothetical protein